MKTLENFIIFFKKIYFYYSFKKFKIIRHELYIIKLHK
jgi:hypothetical protein